MTGRRVPRRSYRDCGAPGCTAKVPNGLLMCERHWKLLPFRLRAAINQTWRERRENGLAAYSANVLEARAFLANHNAGATGAPLKGDR